MVALVSGNSLGLNLTSLATLGARGVAGNAAIGRGTDRAYVNVANGNLVIQNRDDALAAPGPWIDSLRTYNSQEHLGGDHRLPGLQPPRLTTTGGIANVNSSIVRKDADGGEDLYLYDFNRAAYISTDGAGAYDTIRYVNSQLIWTDGDTGLTEYYARYQNEWQLVLRQDSDGNAIRFAYNKDGQVASAIDNAGEGVYYDYANRLLAQVRSVTIAANGTVQTVRVRYGYDSFSRLSSVTVDLSPEDGSIADGRVYVTRYEYDGPSDRITAVRESDGSSLTISYVGAGNDIRVASVANALGETMRFAYDTVNRRTTVTDALGLVTLYDTDAQGQLTRVTGPAIAGGSQVQSFVYNARGDVVQVTDAKGQVTAMEAGQDPAQVPAGDADRITDAAYDAANRLTWQVDPLGGVTHWQRDADGKVLASIRFAQAIAAPTAQAAPLSASGIEACVQADGELDRTRRYAYDAAGRQSWAIDAEGAATAMRYDGMGQVVATTRYASVLDAGALAFIDSRRDAGRNAAIAALVQADATHDRTTHSYYDAANRLAAGIDAEGHVSLNGYDAQGRLVRRESLAQAFDTSALPATLDTLQAALPRDAALDHIDTYAIDAAGRTVSHTNALGATEAWSYDALGNRTRYRNALGATWTYDHDAAGRVTQETSPQVELAGILANADGSLALDAAHSGQAAVITAMRYDALGNLVSRTEAQGRPEQRTTRYAYDALGRQVRTDFPPVGVYDAARDDLNGNGRVGLAERIEQLIALYSETHYDTLGNAVSGRDVGGATSYKTYDRLGRLEYEVDALGNVTGYRRNVFGDVVTLTRYQSAITLPDAVSSANLRAALQAGDGDRSLQQAYDRDGRVVRTEQSAIDAYDSSAPDGLQRFHAGLVTTQRYDAFGDITKTRQLKNPLTDAWLSTAAWYDRNGRQIATLDAAGYLSTQAWDAWGNLVARTEYAQAQVDPSATTASPPAPWSSEDDRSTTFTYDLANRKTAETRVDIEASDAGTGITTRQNATTTYGYDALGNQTRVTDALGATTYTWYDALGTIRAVAAPARASAIDGSVLTPLTEFRRDAYGNVLAQTEFANGAASVDEHGYTLAAASNDDRLTLNRYDSHGRLVQSQDALGIGHYRSYDAGGNLVKSWQAVTAADGITQRTLWQAWNFDALGRQIDALTPLDDGGVIDSGTQYNAFGEVIRQGTDGRWETHDNRDAAGHVWRTNERDGIERIALVDLQGNVTVEISSDGSAPLTATSPFDALSASGIRRIDNRYDALGRLVDRLDIARDASPMQDNGEGGLSWASAAGAERFAVQGANGDWIAIAIVHDDGESTADLTVFGPGDYAWRLEQTDAVGVATTLTGRLHISPGQPARTVSANGVPSIPGISAANGSIGGSSGSDDAAAWLVFTDPGKAYTAVFQYRAAGGDWITLPLVARGDGKVGIDRRAIAAGRYAYQLLLSKPGDSGAPRVIAGTVDLPAYAPTGRKVVATNADGSIRGGMPSKVLRWALPPAGVTAALSIRSINTEDQAAPWMPREVQDEVLGMDASGQIAGFQKASLEGLYPGSYETDLVWMRDGQVIAEMRGQLDIHGDNSEGVGAVAGSSADAPAPSYHDRPSPYAQAYTIAAIPQHIDVASDQPMRPETRQTVDRWGNVLAVNDARSLAGNGLVPTVARSMIGNAVTQGIGVATGLQDHFSWTSVAAAGIGSGVGYAASDALGMHAPEFANAGFGERLVNGTLTGIAAGAAAALTRGGRVTVQQVVVDAFGNALGSGLVDAMQTPSRSADQYSLAYGMRPSLGLKADASYWNDGAAGSYGSYQPEDLSLTGNGVPSLPMQMGDAASDGYNRAADPEVQARAQRFLTMNPMASNDVVDPSRPVVTSDSGQYGFPIPNLDDYPDRVLPNYVVTPDAKAVAEANQSWADTQPLKAVGTSADGGLVWNTGTVSYPVMAPEMEVSALPDTGTQSSVSAMQGQPSLLKRFGTGMLGALESVTIEPVRQIGDLGKAGASVFYNELIRKDGDPYWFPELSSNTAKAYANGVSQTRLILGSTPFVNAGMALSDAGDAWMRGQYGDVAEIAGGLAGGAAIGGGVARYGAYGVTLTDIGATGIRASQAGSIGLKIVVPEATIEGPFNSIVPGGGLAAHELAGGHLLQKHVGKTIDELVARFWKEPEISGSSSFYDRATAEKAVSNVLDINSDKISQWLIGTSNRLVVKSLLPEKTGIFVAPSMRTAISVNGARVVIERDPSMPNGYKILTGYPIRP